MDFLILMLPLKMLRFFLMAIGLFRFQSARGDLVYKTYQAGDYQTKISFCIRRFNLTNSVGCTSAKSGNIGSLVHYSLWNKVNATDRIPSGTKTILMIDVKDFQTISELRSLIKHNRDVNGIIFYQADRTVARYHFKPYQSFSHDSVCPNQNYGMKNISIRSNRCDHWWNKRPNPYLNFALTKWRIPIFLVRNTDVIDRLGRCSRTPNCVAQLKSFMYGSTNSRRCLRRGNMIVDVVESTFCKPIRARNIFSTYFPVDQNDTVPNRTVLLLTARLDSFTMFESWSPGANSVYSSLAVFMTAVHALKQHYRDIEAKRQHGRNILYALFDAESFGYIGSSSWTFFSNLSPNITDDFTDKFPLKTIVQALELNQLFSSGNQHSHFWLHGDWSDNGSRTMADSFLRTMGGTHASKSDTQSMPPSTVSMLRRFDSNISAILVAGYDYSFHNNPFYHSVFDQPDYFDLEKDLSHLKSLATAVAQYLYKFLTGQTGKVEADLSLIQELIRCFVQLTNRCILFDGHLSLNDVQFDLTTPTQREIEVMLGEKVPTHRPHVIANMKLKSAIEAILFYANGHRVKCNPNSTIAKHIPFGFNFTTLLKKELQKYTDCISSQTKMVNIESPYVDYLGRSFFPKPGILRAAVDNLKGVDFSTWTESRFDDKDQPAIRLFIVQSDRFQAVLVILSCAFMILSVWMVRYVETNSDRWFDLMPNRKADIEEESKKSTYSSRFINGSSSIATVAGAKMVTIPKPKRITKPIRIEFSETKNQIK